MESQSYEKKNQSIREAFKQKLSQDPSLREERICSFGGNSSTRSR